MLKLLLLLSIFNNNINDRFSIFIFNEKSKDTLLLNSSDITYYDWNTHELILNDSSINRLKSVIVSQNNFKLVLDGKVLYAGKFDLAIKSEIALDKPTILIGLDKKLEFINGNRIRIWYFGGNKDLRNNIRLKKYYPPI